PARAGRLGLGHAGTGRRHRAGAADWPDRGLVSLQPDGARALLGAIFAGGGDLGLCTAFLRLRGGAAVANRTYDAARAARSGAARRRPPAPRADARAVAAGAALVWMDGARDRGAGPGRNRRQRPRRSARHEDV